MHEKVLHHETRVVHLTGVARPPQMHVSEYAEARAIE